MPYKVGYNNASTLKELKEWVSHELEEVERSVTVHDTLRLVEKNVAPSRPRSGDIALADGSNWNPGAGAGVYAYYGGSWNKLG